MKTRSNVLFFPAATTKITEKGSLNISALTPPYMALDLPRRAARAAQRLLCHRAALGMLPPGRRRQSFPPQISSLGGDSTILQRPLRQRIDRRGGREQTSFHSTAAAQSGALHPNIGKFSSHLELVRMEGEPMKTYRVLDDTGDVLEAVDDDGNAVADQSNDPGVDKSKALEMYRTMIRINVVDSILFEAQRQGRLSFYMQNSGEEATQIGSAAALSKDDVIFAQYREAGVLLWRGFSLQEMCDQCVGNADSSDKGRMMPVHYGSKALNFHTISSPLATQIPQAAGAAYAMKLQGKPSCVVCYFGEGAASEGDFHGGLNFAATLGCPVIFFCRNNGYAISTPVSEQYKGDGIAARGVSYNIKTSRCDGNDVWAVYNTMKEAREWAVANKEPVLIEAMTFRVGHHSTSDDSTRYRGAKEVSAWSSTNNPFQRFKKFLEKREWLEEGFEDAVRLEARAELIGALEAAEKKPKLKAEHLFTDVYDRLPKHLEEQREELKRHLAEHGGEYPGIQEMTSDGIDR